MGFDCVSLKNQALSLLVTQSVGPRIISLCFNNGENLFAELPDWVTQRPDGKGFHFYGGHRLWYAPENMPRTYALDDGPVDIQAKEKSLVVTQPVEDLTGIQKSLKITLKGEHSQIVVDHVLTNCGVQPIECTPWAITQLKLGGVAILPLSQNQTDLLPNRSFTLWSYSDMTNQYVNWGNRYIHVRAEIQPPFKVGFPNFRGWMAYWIDGTLFVKRADLNSHAAYYDFGSSSECYCNDQFLELETLAPITKISPNESVKHIEIWELYANVDFPENEAKTDAIVKELGLE